MRLSTEQLAGHLKRELQPLYTVFGTEPLLALEASDRIRAKARAEGYTEREVLTADSGFKWNHLAMAGSSQSLFASRKLLELRIPTGKPGKEGGEALQNYCQSLPPDTVTLIYVPDLDWRGQKAAWFEALERAGVGVEAKPVLRRALPQWLAQRLAAQGQRVADDEIGQRTLAFFADRVEGNLLAAHQELQKLALLHPAGELSFEQIEAAVLNVARYDVFKLSEAVLGGNVARLLRMLEGLQAEGEAAVLVHWSLAEDIRALKRVRDAVDAGKPLPMALREARVWGPKERLFERIVPGLRSADITRLIEAAQICDGLVKGLRHPAWPVDPWAGLQRLALLLVEATSRGQKIALQ
jgi:DNA polymerase-3 subunit delta